MNTGENCDIYLSAKTAAPFKGKKLQLFTKIKLFNHLQVTTHDRETVS